MRLMRLVFALTIVGGLVLSAGLAPQSVLAVDAMVSGDDCTRDGLAAAIDEAEAPTGTGGTVRFDCEDTNIEFTSEIVIDANVTIDGSNGDGLSIILDGVADDSIDTRMFTVSEGVNLTLTYLTFRHGSMNTDLMDWRLIEWGGAIYNAGNLNISMVSFVENTADRGAAIANGTNLSSAPVSGSLTISQSSFIGNTSGSIGGAIFTSESLSISQSSFINNYGAMGGAIYTFDSGDAADPPQVDITSSTFSGNTSLSGAADIRVERVWPGGSVDISWSTFVQPVDETQPSLEVVAVMGVSLTGLIFGGGGDTPHCVFHNWLPPISHLLSNDSSCDRDTTVDLPWENQDLMLGALTLIGVNGFAQYYHPLAESSPAINAGGTTCTTPDQLGTPRPVGANCDIGAYEYPLSLPEITDIGISPASPIEGEDVTVSVTATDPENQPLTYWIDCENDSVWELTNSTSASTICNYPDNGDYTVAVKVSNGSSSRPDTKVISVANADPEITLFTATPEVAQFGQPVMLSVEASDVPGDLPLTETYSCDGVTTLSTNCSFYTGGTHTVGVTVSDGDGGTDSETKNIFVNSPPANAQIMVSDPALEGPGGTTITVTATDADGDTLYYSIKCDILGDWDIENSTENSVACNYPDEGSYSVSVLVADGSASTTGGKTINVLNAAPKITQFIANPNPVITNQPVVLSTVWTDASADVPNATVTYDCGDGDQLAANTCSFSAFGSHEVSVTVNDHEGGMATQSLDVQVIEPISLCVDQWTGQIREANGDDCGSGETLIELPEDAPLQLCVNQWNGQAKVSNECGRSEYVVMVYGTNDVSVCINKWNGTMRVSESCSRSENQEWL